MTDEEIRETLIRLLQKRDPVFMREFVSVLVQCVLHELTSRVRGSFKAAPDRPQNAP